MRRAVLLAATALLFTLATVFPATSAVPTQEATGPPPGASRADVAGSDSPAVPAVPSPAASTTPENNDLSAAEARGKILYLTGESPSGEEIMALMGDGGIPVPASALPCASCHGRDGRGRPEGGIEPSDLTWDSLTRPYEVTTLTGRTRGPYTPRLLVRAITLGVDASDHELDTVMPRYRLSRQDADDLVAYLRKLGRDRDPGVAEEVLHLGVLLPPRQLPGAAATAAALGRVTDAYARRVNQEGGIYGRRLSLHYKVLPANPAERPDALRDFHQETPLFALVASYTAGAERDLADTVEALELPLIGPLGLHPDESFPLNRQVFHLDGGLPAQAQALVNAAAARAHRNPSPPRLLLVAPPDGPFADLAADTLAAAERSDTRDRFASAESLTPVQLGRDINPGPDDEIILLLPPDRLEIVLTEIPAGHLGIPGNLAADVLADWGNTAANGGEQAPPRWLGRLSLAYDSLPGDRTRAGLERIAQRLGEELGRPNPTELHAYLAMDTLVMALQESGRDLTREGLISRLELVRNRPTGLSRPLSFGPNRRVGSRGAYVVDFASDGSGEPQSVRWIDG